MKHLCKFALAVALLTIGVAYLSAANPGAVVDENSVKERNINISGESSFSSGDDKRSVAIEGYVVNSVTRLGFRDDTIKVELLRPDSTLVSSTYTVRYWNNYPSERGITNRFRIFESIDGEDFILRLSNPDFETVCYDIKVKGKSCETGILEIRRLTRFEKALMLNEVTVRASVVSFVNKGDTIQYNADAFQTAQGSMLDALIEQMPGVELRDDGRIYVNGRFVDKLLLDGKDFFKDNKLVMLQNLPAYTVKNIKVYEKAGSITEVLGKAAADVNNPDPYVMDVTLKKGYNAGWMANAEIGGGTHERYRGRAFGLGYTNRLRLSAFGQINNINETRNPGRSGEWSPAETTDGIMSTKSGGLEFGLFKGNNEYTGNVTAEYTSQNKNVLSLRENFMSDGTGNYIRSWNADRDSKRVISTSHAITLRPTQGNRYNTTINVDVKNTNAHGKESVTQATFDKYPQLTDGMRDSIGSGMLSGREMLNRYITDASSRYNSWYASWEQQTTLRFGSGSNGIVLSSNGFYRNSSDNNNDRNILQYIGGLPQDYARENPQNSHGYQIWFGIRPQFRLSSVFTLQPFFAFNHNYAYNRDMWYYTLSDIINGGENPNRSARSAKILPSMVRDAMSMRPDINNSYTSGTHYTHEYFQLSFSYYKERQVDGKRYSWIGVYLFGGVNNVNHQITFEGFNHQKIKRHYLNPESSFAFRWSLPKMAHYLEFTYKINGTELNMMNLVDLTFNSDPLNLRQGNPDLKIGINHNFKARYQSNRRIFGRLLLGLQGEYDFTTREVAMSYSYNRETGVRIHRPVNIDGGWRADGDISMDINLTKDEKLTLSNYLWLSFRHDVDMISYDDFLTTQKTGINDLYVWDNFGLEYKIGKHMVGFDCLIDTHHTTSDNKEFTTLNTPSFNYGFRGRVVLPYAFELSTDIKMYQRRGHNDAQMNINTLLWNARLTKSLLNGRLILGVDGYDILGNVKSIGYSVNSVARTETWTASIPSYVMFTLRWNFAKKPRE